jgi:hypothetical protein
MDTRAAGSPSKRKRRKVDDDTATASLKQFGSAVHSPGAWRQYHKKQQQQQQQVTGDAPQQQPEQSIISVPLIVEAAAVEQLPSAAAAAAARTNAADGVNYKAFRRKHSSTGQQQQQQQQTLPPASFVVRLLPYDRPVVADMNEYLKCVHRMCCAVCCAVLCAVLCAVHAANHWASPAVASDGTCLAQLWLVLWQAAAPGKLRLLASCHHPAAADSAGTNDCAWSGCVRRMSCSMPRSSHGQRVLVAMHEPQLALLLPTEGQQDVEVAGGALGARAQCDCCKYTLRIT